MNIDDKERLEDLLHHDGVKVLFKELDTVLRGFEEAVLKYNLDTGDEKKLIQLKARHEGAALYVHSLKQRLEKLKRPKPHTRKE